MTKPYDLPVIPSYLYHGESMGSPADYFLVWCVHCQRIHRHGAGDGHRGAHCNQGGNNNPDSPYLSTGYILKMAGTVSDSGEIVEAQAAALRHAARRLRAKSRP